MDWSYLFHVSVVTTSFVGFTSFFLALRQMNGSQTDRAATWEARYLIAVALCTNCMAILPPVLAMNSMSPENAVRVAAVVACLLLTRLDVVYVLHRRRVYCEKLDLQLWVLYVVAIAADVAFAACALGVFGHQSYAVYAAAETAEVVIMFCYFCKGLAKLMPFSWEEKA